MKPRASNTGCGAKTRLMSDHATPVQALLSELRRQGLSIDPQRFPAFCVAHQQLLAFTEHLRQCSLISVERMDHHDVR